MAVFSAKQYDFLASFFAYELSIARALFNDNPSNLGIEARLETTEGLVRLLAQRLMQDNPRFKAAQFFEAADLVEGK